MIYLIELTSQFSSIKLLLFMKINVYCNKSNKRKEKISEEDLKFWIREK